MIEFPLPDAALDSDISILGRKGGGKTITGKGIVERLLDLGRRVIVLDPLGVWAGLRTAADGKAPGYPIAIFGGAFGDLPLDTAAAKPMADVLARENVPTIIDLSELTKGAQQSFLLAFLHELRRANTSALTLVLEEADVFAPQNPQGDDSKQLHGEIDWIARRGRSRGFRLITISQRPARLSKDVLTQAATLIVHKLPAPQDRDAIKAWVEGNGDRDRAREVFDTLARLDIGQAWVWAPDHDILTRARFPMIRTLDTSSTPKAGETKIEQKTLAQVDVSAIRGALSEARKEPAAKSGNANAVDLKAIEDAERRGYDRGYTEGVKNGRRAATMLIETQVSALIEAVEKLKSGTPAPEPRIEAREIARDASPVRPLKRIVDSGPRTEASSLGAERRILAVLARVHPAGMTEPQWAVAAGMKRTGGTWGTYKSRLRVAGAIEERRGLWFAAAAGVELVGEVAPMPAPGPALVDFWAERIPAAGRMLREIVSAYPRAIHRDDLARRLDMTASGGTFGTYLSRLRAPGLIETANGSIRAVDSLMRPVNNGDGRS